MRIKGTFWFPTFYRVFFGFDSFFLSRSLTLSGLLNIVDGVGAGEGRILVATTNYHDRLDEALTCPGRIDLEIKFELASKFQAREQFCQFYVPQTVEKEKGPGIALTNKALCKQRTKIKMDSKRISIPMTWSSVDLLTNLRKISQNTLFLLLHCNNIY